jgi:2-hydroxychromene-2-carboxylate isomerase
MTRAMTFHFDFVSPYAYLAWTQLPRLAQQYDRTIDLVPVLFPAMLDAFGTKGPAETPVKRTYAYLDVIRKAKLLGVPIEPPPRHPFVPLLPLRIAAAHEGEARATIVDALFRATWETGRGIDDDALVADALAARGLDAASAIERGKGHAAKATLLRTTSDAIARGVFGVPTFDVEGERFWGVDAIPSLEAFLRGEDPITPALRARIASIPVGATRKAAG